MVIKNSNPLISVLLAYRNTRETKFCGDGDRGLKFVRKLDLKEISRNL